MKSVVRGKIHYSTPDNFFSFSVNNLYLTEELCGIRSFILFDSPNVTRYRTYIVLVHLPMEIISRTRLLQVIQIDLQ